MFLRRGEVKTKMAFKHRYDVIHLHIFTRGSRGAMPSYTSRGTELLLGAVDFKETIEHRKTTEGLGSICEESFPHKNRRDVPLPLQTKASRLNCAQ